MKTINRRTFLYTAAVTGALAGAPLWSRAEASPSKRSFTLGLSCGPLGVPDDPRKVIGWAREYGFEAIEPSASFLGRLNEAELQQYRAEMLAAKLTWTAAGLPVDFRGNEAAFQQGMKSLPDYARALQRAGVTRVATWLSPGHRSLTYVANFRQHATRLREVAQVLSDHGLRLGLEYVGPKTAWSSSRFPFIHTMAEMKDLIAEIHRDNVGFLLDSWHWYTAGETSADLLTLKAKDVVLCHLNDAPKGVPVDQQIDSRRELPCATGVIDLKAFLGAMLQIAYDGSLVCEPFSNDLRKMPADQALATVAAAMKKAVALVEA